MQSGLQRRQFLTLLGGAIAWPLAARAQQPKVPVVGYLRSESFDDTAQRMIAGFRQGLKEAGYIEGQNVAIEFRSAQGRLDRLPALVADLVRHPVAVIVGNLPAAKAAKATTATVPIVFVYGGDPVKDGLVASFNRPGGNLTGATFLGGLVGGRRVQLLHDLTPQAGVIALLIDANYITSVTELNDLEGAVHALGLNSVVGKVAKESEIDAAFATFAQQRAGALVVGNSPFFTGQIERIVALAARHALPASYQQREFAAIGGLMSYGTSLSDAYRQAGIYVGQILKGTKPADLPVMRPTKYELVINLKTAKALGLDVPAQLLALADEVIE
jgi:putative tryptophan/tyrosine transport system substrate-binding protein